MNAVYALMSNTERNRDRDDTTKKIGKGMMGRHER